MRVIATYKRSMGYSFNDLTLQVLVEYKSEQDFEDRKTGEILSVDWILDNDDEISVNIRGIEGKLLKPLIQECIDNGFYSLDYVDISKSDEEFDEYELK